MPTINVGIKLESKGLMVGTGRFELPTPRTPSECSTRLSHVPTQSSLLAAANRPMGSKSVYTSQPSCAGRRLQIGAEVAAGAP